jgi:glutaredoxin 3
MEKEKKEHIPQITNKDEMEALQDNNRSFLAILFYSDSSQRSQKAFKMLSEIKKETADIPLVAVNVSKTRDVHSRFGVSSVPTVITLSNRRVIKKIEGLQGKSIYRLLFSQAPRKRADGSEAPPLRVTVYSSPICPPCGTVKAYLRKKNVPFRVIDVSRDQRAAQEIANRSGSMAVPQIDINGTIVVGADMARIDELLRR